MQDTPNVNFQDLGIMDYAAAWDYQTRLHQTVVANKVAHRGEAGGSYPQQHYLLFVEHPPVYTLGRSGSMDNLLLNEAELAEKGIQFFPINRGGDITFHGPGQLVGYPILDLECFFTDVHRYVRNIETVIIRTLADYGIAAYHLKDYTGVWVTGETPGVSGEKALLQRKICAIGVHLSRWTTLHGWAFNVNTDLNYFNYMVPCGIAEPDKTVTSLAVEMGSAMDMEAVKDQVRQHFSDVFGCSITLPATEI
jgi:lipoyl(octanoyl) transferase